KAVDEDGTNYPALVNVACLERRSQDRAKLAAQRLALVKEEKWKVELTRSQKIRFKTTLWKETDETHRRRRLLRDTLWYQAAYSLAVIHLQLGDADTAYWAALELGYELEAAPVDLHQLVK